MTYHGVTNNFSTLYPLFGDSKHQLSFIISYEIAKFMISRQEIPRINDEYSALSENSKNRLAEMLLLYVDPDVNKSFQIRWLIFRYWLWHPLLLVQVVKKKTLKSILLGALRLAVNTYNTVHHT